MLGPDDSIDRTPVTPAVIPEDALQAEREKLAKIIERRKKQQQRAKKKPSKQ